MSGSGVVLGTSTTATGAAAVAVLPNTGGFRPLFVMASVALAAGVVTLIVTGVASVARKLN